MKGDLTRGPVMKTMLIFAVPMILGNLLQQCYNVADTLIVGRFLGPDALAAVGSSFTLMTFLTSILLGLCMGSSAVFSIRFGQKDFDGLKDSIFTSFLLIAAICAVLNLAAFLSIGWILLLLKVPEEIQGLMRDYLMVIFSGITAVFLYNYFSCLLRAIGNSVIPLVFLAFSAVMNIGLDLWFVLGLKQGVAGAAEATVISQYVSGIGIAVYSWFACPWLRIGREHCRIRLSCLKEIAGFSVLTCVQQSVMNLGILMVQGLVNSFGTTVMAAFAVAVKIDSFAYMPVQDFGNAFSSFIAQNFGAGRKDRIHAGFRGAVLVSLLFCLIISAVIWMFARPLMLLFVNEQETAIIAEGIRYLHIEGAFYCGIGCLFLLYGLYRALGRPGMSVVLTVISLGTRVALAYILSSIPEIGVVGIWWSVPIGWILADAAGFVYFIRRRRLLL
ncbi:MULTISPECIES: MATE family efflux transporter [Hungatella]|uniref:Probable multidrug resistance protein NorM n=1 Tax=Hungatella hathewayi TaxID=154046 RepID=A0AAW9WAA1_9FIRM|nr:MULTISPECIES: MATE family efflux transporter [Hungatella]MCQ4827600.1 MATE family efflux transporter [Hungatella sp. SL.1.14]MUB61708.1 MATE family efflux transporter [Hungatella hathewayi]CUP06726.1 putative efflux protein%2C MATE family [Hungatella hathewayi]